MKLLWRSLTVRLLVLFILLAIVPAVAIGYLAFDSGRQSIVSNVEAHLESVAILKEQELENWVTHLQHSVSWVAKSPPRTSAAATLVTQPANDPEYPAAHDFLVAEFKRLVTLGNLSSVFFLEGASGQIIASSDPNQEGQFRETESWFIQGKISAYVSEIFHSLALGRPALVIAAPVTDSEGQLLGVLAAHANLEGLSELMLERSGLGETGQTYLVNEGNLLLTDLRFGPGVAFRKWVFTEGVSRALEGESGVGLYLDHKEEPVIGAYRWLEDREMVLLAELDQAEAFAPVVALRNTVFGIGLAVALVVALLGVLFARTITRPVRQLVRGAEQVGRGNLDYRIEVRSQDEIGQLSQAYNQMAENLKAITASRDELNREITERMRAEETLKQTLGELEDSRAAALNMMMDADEARRMAERANEDLKREIAERVRAGSQRDAALEELKKYRDQLEDLVEERTGELRDAQEQLIRREKLAVLGQLASGVGHELRNPLGAIKNAAYFLNMVLCEADPDLEIREMLEVLDREVDTAEKIISSLLDFARARAPIRRKVDVNGVVQEALSRTPLPAAKRPEDRRGNAPRVEVVCQLDEDLPFILADPDQLSQVIGNLIRNGIQAMPEGGRLVVRTAMESPEWVTVSVADSGIGIAPDNLTKIFEPLFTTKAKGIGLGLAVVKTLVEGHGGAIEVESRAGEGSTFTVRLPLAASAAVEQEGV